MEKFTFFWKSDSPFSQWHTARFTIDGIEFNCAEQYMMFMKAKLFNDEEIMTKILKQKSPMQHKALGRMVKGFKNDIWEKECIDIVYRGNLAKFTQNPELLEALLRTKGTTLVEASPLDKIWGVGLAEDNPKIKHRQNWKGKNLLGEILTRIRDELSANE